MKDPYTAYYRPSTYYLCKIPYWQEARDSRAGQRTGGCPGNWLGATDTKEI